jgi:hypothetical protein
MRLAVENTTWNNIGDGFYQTSIENMLREMFPGSAVSVFEGPIRRAFRPRSGALGGKAFDLGQVQDADAYVLSGPILNGEFSNYYGELIKRWHSLNKPYLLLSAHGTYRPAIDLLRKYPPVALSTRDEATFAALDDVDVPKMNGVCYAFFVSKTMIPCDIAANEQFIVSSFYKSPEPSLALGGSGMPLDQALQIGVPRVYRRPAIQKHLLWFRPYPGSIGPYKIIRAHHDIGMRLPTSHYSYPNSFFSFNPSGYLSLYKHTACTITDRVHAAVVTMSFGNPAIYCSASTRDGLFTANGITRQQGQARRIEPECLDRQYDLAREFVRAAIERL